MMNTKKFVTSIVKAANAYSQRGFYVVPIPNGKNHPVLKGWQKMRLRAEEVKKAFSNAGGIGLLLKPSNVTDIDIDCQEGVAAADVLLPPTGMVHGRRGNPRSHRYYRATPSPQNKSYADPRQPPNGERASLIELRANGQTVVPPSRHWKTDEPITWESQGEPAAVDAEDLQRAVAQVAAGALLAHYWPQGSRHFAALALAGMLLRAGWSEPATEKFLLAVTRAAADEETSSRLHDVVSTAQRLPSGQPATGAPTLAGIVGDDITNKVRDWLQLGVSSGSTSNRIGLVKELSDDILSTDSFAQDSGGWLYRYANGVYKPDGEAHVKRRVKAQLEARMQAREWSSSRADEVVEYIRVDSPSVWERPPLDNVNVANGLLDTKAGELKPHSPEFLSPVQLPVKYDPTAKCPAWEKFVSEVFPDDSQEIAWEVPAWLMTPDISIQKALLLLGEGSNGKSVYLEAVRAFLGRTNTSAESLHSLESNRFAVAQLVGKLANICPDLPSMSLAGSSVFKAITGGDYMIAERKFKQAFTFQPFSRLVFSGNYLPRSIDASHAYFRRWMIVPFRRTFETDEQIPRQVLDARLAAPSELSGVLNRALAALGAIRKRRGLSQSESVSKAGEEFVRLTDPVAVWLDARTSKDPDAMVAKKALLDAYNETARHENRPPITGTALGLAVRRLFPDVEGAQRKVAGTKRWVWRGIELHEREG
jgi:P4 family phage/plasmid primase-like protien